jgi:hypothetical protein
MRKYTKGLRWHQNQTKRALRSIDKKNSAQMGCAITLTVLLASAAALFLGWTQI